MIKEIASVGFVSMFSLKSSAAICTFVAICAAIMFGLVLTERSLIFQMMHLIIAKAPSGTIATLLGVVVTGFIGLINAVIVSVSNFVAKKQEAVCLREVKQLENAHLVKMRFLDERLKAFLEFHELNAKIMQPKSGTRSVDEQATAFRDNISKLLDSILKLELLAPSLNKELKVFYILVRDYGNFWVGIQAGTVTYTSKKHDEHAVKIKEYSAIIREKLPSVL